MSDIPLFNSQIDKNKVPAIHKKRILAFLNDFILKNAQFMNDLVKLTEEKFIVFDQKLNKIQNSLEILEAKVKFEIGCWLAYDSHYNFVLPACNSASA